MKVIITGAGGFIGSNLVNEFLKNGDLVFAIDFNLQRIEEINNPNLVLINLNMDKIADLTGIIREKEIDCFYHLAWSGSSGELRSNVDVQMKNALWAIEALKCAIKLNCKKFIASGSIMEFETLQLVYDKKINIDKTNVYGSGKILAHLLTKSLAGQSDIDYIWTFITNTYGIGEESPRLINTTIRNVINNIDCSFGAGTQIYDFIYITDLVTIFRLLGIYGKNNEKYIIGSGSAKPLKGFLLSIKKTLNSKVDFVFDPKKMVSAQLTYDDFNTDSLKRDIKYEPKITFEEGIKLTYEWLKEKTK